MKYLPLIIIAVILVILVMIINYFYFCGWPVRLNKTKYKITTEKLTVSWKDKTLAGELYLPAGKEGKLPLVIAVHGYGASYRFGKWISKSLTKAGYAVYAFDFYGGNDHSISGGKMTEMSIPDEKDQLLKIIEALKANEKIDAEQIYLLGESQGGVVSALAAKESKKSLKAMVLYYPAFSLFEDARETCKDGIPETKKMIGHTISKYYYEPILEMDPYQEIRGFDKNVLIIHGSTDALVPVEYGKKAAGCYRHALFIELPNQKHGFNGIGKRNAVRRVYHFLEGEKE